MTPGEIRRPFPDPAGGGLSSSARRESSEVRSDPQRTAACRGAHRSNVSTCSVVYSVDTGGQALRWSAALIL